MHTVLQDIRHGVRLLLKNPAISLLAVIALDAAGNERRAERSFTITSSGCSVADLQPADGISGSTVSSLMTSRLKILEHLIGQLQDSMP